MLAAQTVPERPLVRNISQHEAESWMPKEGK
jgi:hypothetical protein